MRSVNAIISVVIISTMSWPSTAANVSHDQAVRIIAASPLRELYRNWDQCIDETLLLMKFTGATDVATIESWMSMNCDEDESRLTGELIKRQGYDRGNAVMNALKTANRARFGKFVQQVTAKPNGQYAEIGEWVITRNSRGQCFAIQGARSIGTDTRTAIALDKTGWIIDFMKESGSSGRYRSLNGPTEIYLSFYGSNGMVGGVRSKADFKANDRYLNWSMPLDQSILPFLAKSNLAQFTALPEEQTVTRVFPVENFSVAFASVRECAAQRQ